MGGNHYIHNSYNVISVLVTVSLGTDAQQFEAVIFKTLLTLVEDRARTEGAVAQVPSAYLGCSIAVSGSSWTVLRCRLYKGSRKGTL